MYRLNRPLSVMLAMLLSSCATSNTVNGSQLVEAARVPGKAVPIVDSVTRAEKPCLIVLGSFVDRRRRDGEIGEINGKAVKSGEVVEWLREAFQAELESDSRVRVVGMDPGGSSVYIDGEILSVYVVDEKNTLIANIVMRLIYSTPGGTYKPGLAFGSTSVSAVSGEPAIRDVFEIALSDLLAGARDNLENACMTVRSGRAYRNRIG